MRPAECKRTLMVCIDHSDHSKYVFKWAVDNLIRNDDYLLIVTCHSGKPNVAGKEYSIVEGTPQHADLDERAEFSRHQALMQTARAELHKTMSAISKTVILRTESPKSALVQLSEDQNVDLMIMGSRGLGAVKKALIGSVSDYCVNNAPCPVLIVRRPKAAHQ